MKTSRLILVLVLAFIVFGVLLYTMPTDIVSAVDMDSATLYIHCMDYWGDNKVIVNGASKIVVCSVALMPDTIKQCSTIKGIDLQYNATSIAEVDNIVERLKVQVYSQDRLQNIVTLYGYSPMVRGGIVVDNNLVNIQIAYSNGVLTIGSPIILGSF